MGPIRPDTSNGETLQATNALLNGTAIVIRGGMYERRKRASIQVGSRAADAGRGVQERPHRGDHRINGSAARQSGSASPKGIRL